MSAGRIPSRTSESAKTLSSEATTMSQAAASPTPPPKTLPWTRATTGFGRSASEWKRPPSRVASARFCSKLADAEAFMAAMSAPAQNDAPRPPRTITRTEGSWARAWKASFSSSANSVESALCCSGRLSHTRATARSRATSIRPGTATLLAAPLAGFMEDSTVTTESLPREIPGRQDRGGHPWHVHHPTVSPIAYESGRVKLNHVRAARRNRTRAHIRSTPNRISGIGAFRLAASARLRTVRVSTGAMTPSSQSRAVE